MNRNVTLSVVDQLRKDAYNGLVEIVGACALKTTLIPQSLCINRSNIGKGRVGVLWSMFRGAVFRRAVLRGAVFRGPNLASPDPFELFFTVLYYLISKILRYAVKESAT